MIALPFLGNRCYPLSAAAWFMRHKQGDIAICYPQHIRNPASNTHPLPNSQNPPNRPQSHSPHKRRSSP